MAAYRLLRVSLLEESYSQNKKGVISGTFYRQKILAALARPSLVSHALLASVIGGQLTYWAGA
jgi:hypothetical protein